MDEQPDDDRIFQKDSINQGDFVSGDKIERQVLHQQLLLNLQCRCR